MKIKRLLKNIEKPKLKRAQREYKEIKRRNRIDIKSARFLKRVDRRQARENWWDRNDWAIDVLIVSIMLIIMGGIFWLMFG